MQEPIGAAAGTGADSKCWGRGERALGFAARSVLPQTLAKPRSTGAAAGLPSGKMWPFQAAQWKVHLMAYPRQEGFKGKAVSVSRCFVALLSNRMLSTLGIRDGWDAEPSYPFPNFAEGCSCRAGSAYFP